MLLIREVLIFSTNVLVKYFLNLWYTRKIYNGYNRRQNELRHFAQDWAFLRFINFKRRKYSVPPPSPPCNVVPLF